MSTYEIMLLGELASPVLLGAVALAAVVGAYVLGLRAGRRTDRMVDFQSFMEQRETARQVQHLRHVAALAAADDVIARTQQIIDGEGSANFAPGRAPVPAVAGSDLPPRDAGISEHADAALILQQTLIDPGDVLAAVSAAAPAEPAETVEESAPTSDAGPPPPPGGAGVALHRYNWPDQVGALPVRGVMPREWLGTLRRLAVATLTATTAARAPARPTPRHRQSARQAAAERRERAMREWYADLRTAVFGQPGQHRPGTARRRLAPDWQTRQQEIVDRLFAPMGGRL